MTWAAMVIYWAIGASVAVPAGYYRQLSEGVSLRPKGAGHQIALIVAWLVTLTQQALYYKRTSDLGRPFSLFSQLVFPLANALFETFLFFAAFDMGKGLALGVGLPFAVAFALGFVSFSVYSGIIHAKWWEPHVLPFHLMPRDGRLSKKSDRFGHAAEYRRAHGNEPHVVRALRRIR